MDAAIYIRVSSDGQEDNTSLETQIAYCQRYADTTGLHVSGIYRDVASGGSMERRDLHRLRVLVREGLIDAIIVLSMDRLTREGGDWKELEKEFRRAGIALHSATQGEINLNDPTARLMTGFMIGYAEYEREIIKARMVRGKDSKADSGMPVGLGRSSYGYTVEVTRAGARKHHAWCLHDVHAPIVLRIFSEYVAGATVDNIARALTLEGIPTPGDDGRKPGNRKRGYGEWSAFNVYHILACETYTGRFYQHRFKAIEEKWKNGTGKNKLVLRPREEWKVTPVPAIIDDDLWHQAQARLAQGKAKAKRNARRFYLLGGQRFTCGICGYTMCGSLSHGEGFYRCGGTKRAGGTRAVQSCEGHRVASDTVEHAVWTWIKSILVPERLLLGIEEENERANAQRLTVRDERAALEAERAALDTKRQKTLAAYGADAISRDELKASKDAYEASMKRVGDSLRRLDALEQSTNIADLETLLREAEQIRSRMDDCTPEEQQGILDLLHIHVTRVTLDGEEAIQIDGTLGTATIDLTYSQICTRLSRFCHYSRTSSGSHRLRRG